MLPRKDFIAGILAATALVAVGAFAITPHDVAAQGFSLVVECARNQTETPGLRCVIEQFTNIARFILSITGSVALLIFVIAGFMYLFNAGNPDQAKKATSYITNAAIGLVIIFCSGILVNYLQRQLRDADTTDAACEALGESYSCLDTSKVQGVNCQTGLCLSNASASYRCCQPATEPFVSQKCKAEKGDTYKCMNKNQGVGCVKNLCPGSADIQCCQETETTTPGGTAPATTSFSCSNLATGEFLGCTASNCQAVGAPCQTENAGTDCLQLTNDVRCTTPGTPPAIYGCYSGTGADRELRGCVEVNNSCGSLCDGQDFCGFLGPRGKQPDPDCISQG